MSVALSRSSAVQHFECGNMLKILDRIIFNFYTILPQSYISLCSHSISEQELSPLRAQLEELEARIVEQVSHKLLSIVADVHATYYHNRYMLPVLTGISMHSFM